MKTKCSGSKSGCASNQALRRAAMSDRSCSLAWAVFFEGHGVTIKEAPNRTRCEGCVVLASEHVSQLDERDIRLRLNRRQDDVSISFNAM